MSLRTFEIDAILASIVEKVESKQEDPTPHHKKALSVLKKKVESFKKSADFKVLKKHQISMNLFHLKIFLGVDKLLIEQGGFTFIPYEPFRGTKQRDDHIYLDGGYRPLGLKPRNVNKIDKAAIKREIILSQLKETDVEGLIETLVEKFS